jgi:hypothetical protein
MISRIFGSFKLVCAEKIEAGDDPADPVLAFKSKKQQCAARSGSALDISVRLEVRPARAVGV